MQFLDKLMHNDWCLVVTVQTTVEVPRLLGVPVEIPRVQFLDNFDTVVSSSSVFQLRSTWALLSLFFQLVTVVKQ